MWLFCLCVFLLAQPEEILVIDDFESEGGWQPHAPAGSTLRVIRDSLNAKVGRASLGMEAEFTAPCGEERCYAIISREAPDLSDYAYLKLWIRTGSPTEAYFGIALRTADEKDYLYLVPLDKTGWNLITVAFSQFTSREDPHGSPAPEDIKYISLVLGSDRPLKVRVNVDNLLALTEDRLVELSEITGTPVPPLSEKPDSSVPQPRDKGGGGLLFVFIVVALVGIGVYMWKFRGAPQPEKAGEEPVSPLTSSEAKAEEIRKLKAKFVYGEINRQEYEKRLRELEDRA